MGGPNAGDLGQPDARTPGSRPTPGDPTFRSLVPIATRPIFGAEPGELSLLFTLFYIAASGNEKNPGTFERNFDTRDGAQMSRFVGGSQLIALKMARSSGAGSSSARRCGGSSRARAASRVISDRMTVRAKGAIVAVPPTLAGRI